MPATRVLRSILWLLGGVIALLVIAVLIVSLVRIPINVSSYKGLLESAASDALGRRVNVDGDIRVTTSLWPYFEIAGIRVANPDGFGTGDLVSMEHARVRVGLLSLLARRIRIKTFRVDGMTLNLVENEQGAVNWAIGAAQAPAPSPSEDEPPVEPPRALSPDALAVDEIVLENISTSYRNPRHPEAMEFNMDRASGSAMTGEPMELQMTGVLLGEPFTLRIDANSLGEFLAFNHSQLQIEIDIAETRLHLDGSSDAFGGRRTGALELRIEGERLDSLDDLLGLDLPPLSDYRLAAHLAAAPGKLELSGLEIRVRDSSLTGSMVVDKTGARPSARVELAASRIQLDDFDTGAWSPDQPDSEPPPLPPNETESDPGLARTRAKLLSPEALQRADLRLEVRVDEVRSGRDALGSGELTLGLTDGRIALDPLRLQLPSGRLLLKASVRPGLTASDASLRVLIEKFDFGALIRLQNPESDVGGTLSMDIDVTARASDIRNLLTGANGYLDVSSKPENLRSGVVDLWAVNLLSSVVSESAKGEDVSRINCVFSRWSLTDGSMTAQSLAVDTSKIRICGKGGIDFDDRTFDLTVAPVAKRPEFFSLATPLAVTGSFEDFDIGTKAGVLSLGTTAVKFAISPVTTPFERLVREDLPADGDDICSLPIGPHSGELEPLPGC
jgi:uncharacterized protein involved in outer membrane biogenesis